MSVDPPRVQLHELGLINILLPAYFGIFFVQKTLNRYFIVFIMVWDYYDGKVLFVTGGSGFIGTALLWRLLSQSSPERVYVLCRGGYA
jgi:hypothetical protein